MAAQNGLFLGTIVPMLLASTAALAATDPELQPFRGAWVLEGAKCENVFYRQGTSIQFHRPGAKAREGILIHGGNRIEDGRNRCHIKKVTTEGGAKSLLVTCLAGLSVSRLSFLVRFIDKDAAVRSHTDSPNEQVRLRRCKL